MRTKGAAARSEAEYTNLDCRTWDTCLEIGVGPLYARNWLRDLTGCSVHDGQAIVKTCRRELSTRACVAQTRARRSVCFRDFLVGKEESSCPSTKMCKRA